MPHPAHPQARLSDARGNCAQNPAEPATALLRLLLALLATLLGQPRTGLRLLLRHTAASPALAASDAWTAELWEQEDEEQSTWTAVTDAQGLWAPLRGWHADCDPAILYVIGPPPNRGMRALARAHPPARPKSARAPPRTKRRRGHESENPLCLLVNPSWPRQARKSSPTGAAHARPICSDIVT